MIKNTLDLVKILTDRDTKNLSQKGLKLAEECGELSKNILPYENADGTLHRFVKKEKIAENCVDTILVALSIAYSLGYSDDALANIMLKKSNYWSMLQDNEKNVDIDRMPHELHITVKEVDTLQRFVEACESASVKPIVLDLHSKANTVLKDMMTSSVFIGPSSRAYDEVLRIKAILEVYGFEVIRAKIEVPPFHPAAPNETNTFSHEKNRYFESHIEVILDSDEKFGLEKLKEFAERKGGVHVSANAFKRHAEVTTVMLTYRNSTMLMEQFMAEVKNLRHQLESNGYILNGKDIIEYCLYDSATNHDNTWLFGKN